MLCRSLIVDWQTENRERSLLENQAFILEPDRSIGMMGRPRVTMICVFILIVSIEMAASDNKPNVPKVDLTSNLPSVCHRNCPKNVKDTRTWLFCETNDELKMEGRCCVNTTANAKSDATIPVLGIDLQDCGMNEKQFATGIQNISTLAVISLEGNPMKNITAADFNMNSGIIYLSLPVNMSCPGGADAWSEITFDASGTLCQDELNLCHYAGVSCPTNSHCEPAGIKLTQCLCNEGYHGYKCLNKGTFPAVPYAIGLAVPVVVCSIFLWVTQRRHVKKTA